MTDHAPPARLQAMSLPNGKTLLVLDRWSGPARDAETGLRAAVPDAYVIVSDRPIEVHSWPSDDLATAAAEACAMTHGEEDAVLITQVRAAFASLHGEAEAWRDSGRHAVERLADLEEERTRLLEALREIRKVADDPATMVDRVARIAKLVGDALVQPAP